MRKSFTRHSYSLSRRGPTAGRLNRVVAQWKIEADARAKAEKEKKEKTNGKRCSRCGFRIRGKNHEEGVHHQQGRNRTTGNHLRKS